MRFKNIITKEVLILAMLLNPQFKDRLLEDNERNEAFLSLRRNIIVCNEASEKHVDEQHYNTEGMYLLQNIIIL